MKNYARLIITGLMLVLCYQASSEEYLWQIGEKNDSANEFALAPSHFRDFIAKDFGYEDKYYLVGFSATDKDFPYVLPGPVDTWAGTWPTAGWRTHQINILFGLDALSSDKDAVLNINLADFSKRFLPLVKISVNSQDVKVQLEAKGLSVETQKKPGMMEPVEDTLSLSGNYSEATPYSIEIPIKSGTLKKGGNEVIITVLEGSWILFDNITLTAPEGAHLAKPGKVFVRNVAPADYQLNDNGHEVQPLLLDVEHLTGEPEVTVEMDGKVLISEKIESGRYQLEVPMPAVSRRKTSVYKVFADGKLIAQDKVLRSPQRTQTLADYVDTRIGTAHSRWMIAPGPWMPFSMVKLSPDNQNTGWQGGYQPSFENIGCFSHIHEWTLGGLGIMAANGELKTRVGDEQKPDEGYRSRIDKRTETAGIGYYSADLTDYGIKAEITATTRCGFGRFTFPEKRGDGRILIELHPETEYGIIIKGVSVRKVSDYRLEGVVHQYSPGVWSHDADQDYNLNFVIEFDAPIKTLGSWIEDKVSYGIDELKTGECNAVGLFAEFDSKKDKVVQFRSGISPVSTDNASENLESEVSSRFAWSFDAVRENQIQTWNDIFSRVRIKTDNRLEKVRFYNNMYRAICSRNIWSDVNGEWVSTDGAVRKVANPATDVMLGCDAFWNTFWNLNQFWNLVIPEWSGRWVRSQLSMYDANGWLAKGPAGLNYIPVMVGEHEIPLIVSAYQMGIRDFDHDKALEAAIKMQTTPARKVFKGFAGNRDLESYMQYGYVPYDKGRFSNTMEYSYDDWTVGQLAKALGDTLNYNRFNDRGYWWRHVISEDGYCQMKDSKGQWLPDFDPFRSGANQHYVEGNAWQLTFFVPQDVPALVEKIGRDRFVDRLLWGFNQDEAFRYNAPNDQYWDHPVVQGNQQSMHFAYLFNYAGAPWYTQKWSRSILERYYGCGVANAYLGDEDQGQMSAWAVMTSLGLFQMDGGCSTEPVYEIASPLFEEVTIDLGGRYGRGHSFTIKANNTSRKNIYVQSAVLNGRRLSDFSFPASELLKGGELILEMGPEPNKDWGVSSLATEILKDPLMDKVDSMARVAVRGGFNAGDGYGEVWIRDYNTFIELAMEELPDSLIQENLLTFFRFQGDNGDIPDGFLDIRKIVNSPDGYKYRYSDSEPRYAAHKNTVETDQESSLIQAVCKYVTKSGNRQFLNICVDGKTVLERMARALDYLTKERFSDKYGLLWGATTVDWGDVQPEHPWGVELDANSHLCIDIYDNAFFIIAINDFLSMSDNEVENARWRQVRDSVKDNVRKYLWDEERQKFKPHIYLAGSPFPENFDEDELYYHGGTAVAIEAGLLDRSEIKAANDAMVANVKAAGAPSIGLTVYPPYPEGFFKNKGMYPYGYQNGGDWTWFGGRMICQLIANGFVAEAYEEVRPMLERVVENNGFFEWYSVDGKPSGSGTFRGEAGVLSNVIKDFRNWAEDHED